MLGFISMAALVLRLASLTSAAESSAELFQLTPANFDTEIAHGHWFVEHFSPYCIHCKNFLPTWEKLVKQAAEELSEVRLAQINCAEHGDLCEKDGIKGYPTMLLFEDGKIIEKYNGARVLVDLMSYLKEHVHKEDADDDHDEPHPDHHEDDDDVPPPAEKGSVLNPRGELAVLSQKSFSSTLALGPTFVKFYAPWCGHCKKLAPVWTNLAKELQGKVQVAEVNCDTESALCKTHSIQGYPTLVYFSHGSKSEYTGGRKLEQLKAFAEKASGDPVEYINKLSELEAHVHDEQVAYLLLYTAGDHEILKIVREDAAVLLGSPQVYATSSPSIRHKYGIAKHVPWALIALKDHDLDTPTSVFPGTPQTARDDLQKWLVSNKVPGYLELTQDTFQGVMSAPHGPLVVIAPSNEKLEKAIEDKVVELSSKWKERTRGSGVVGGKEVIFAWMDGERWKDWMKSMYDVKIDDDEDDLDDVKIVVANHKDLVYYDQDRSGRAFTLTAPERLFKSLEDIASGKLGYKNSENVVERLARSLNTKMTAFEEYVVEYPFRFVTFLIVGMGVLFYVLYKWVGSDVASLERGDHIHLKSKNGRLD